MKTGNGKIANLPAEIREELNYRISHGDAGNELVQWLNSKPEVVEVVNELFDGTPISEQNLSEWRKHGYQKWLAHRNMFDESNALGDNAEVLAETGIDCDKLILTLTAAYAEATQNWIITPREQMLYKLAVYKNLVSGVIALQRAELQKIRLEIARERLELLREKRQNKSPSSASPSTERASPPANAPTSQQSASDSRHSSFELRHSAAPAAAPSAPPAPATQSAPATNPPTPAPAVAYHKHGLKPLLIHGIPVFENGKQVMTRNGVRVGSSFRPAPLAAPGTATQASSRVPMGPPLSKIPPPRSIPPRPAPKP